MTRFVPLVLLGAALAAAACGPRRVVAPGPGPAAGPVRAPPEVPISAHGSYGPEPAASLTPLERAALEAVRARLASGTVRPTTSPALILAARELARGAPGSSDPLAPARLRAALVGALAFDPAPVAHLVVADPVAAPAALADRLSAPAGVTHVGIGAFERGGRASLVLLLSRRRAALHPFPREVARGASAVLRGELNGLESPSVHVTPPSGRSAAVPSRTLGARALSASIRFDVPGRWVVELIGAGPRGPEVAALMVVSCGGQPLAGAVHDDPPDPPDGRAAEARVIDAVNETRRVHGLPPLTPWPELSEVARRHSAAMLEAREVAHRLPGSPGAGERLRRAGLPYAAVMENVAKGPGALPAHRLIEESPAHRQNVLSPSATRIGCGIARGTLPGGERVVYLTELFVEPLEDGDGDRLSAETRVREAIWRERQRAGRPPLLADPGLDELARAGAEEMLRAGSPGAEPLAERALRAGRRTVAADGLVAVRAADAARSRNVADPRFTRVGVGVAVGDHPRYGSGRLWIAIVYSD